MARATGGPVTGVPPGGTFAYVWPVPARAGPGPMDGSSVLWMYHSHVDEVRDINSGLLGPMIVTARGMARPDGSPKDVDREFVTAFAQVEENFSWLADREPAAARFSAERLEPMPNPSETDAAYPWYVKFTINGFIHGSMPLADLTMPKGPAGPLVRHVLDQRLRRPRARTGTATMCSSAACGPTCLPVVHGNGRSPTWCPTIPARGCSTATSRSTTRRGWRCGTR